MTELSIPDKIKAMVPKKPTQAQLINALVEKARKHHAETYEERVRSANDYQAEAAAIIARAFANPEKFLREGGTFTMGSGGVQFLHGSGTRDLPEHQVYRVSVKSPDLDAIAARREALGHASSYFDAREVKRKITESLARSRAPDFSSPGVQAALDNMLAEIGIIPRKNLIMEI